MDSLIVSDKLNPLDEHWEVFSLNNEDLGSGKCRLLPEVFKKYKISVGEVIIIQSHQEKGKVCNFVSTEFVLGDSFSFDLYHHFN